MEGFNYIDIFDTKGVEYLIVIAFLLILIPTWIILNKPVRIKNEILRSAKGITGSLLEIPKGVFMSRNHTWAFMEKTGIASIGLDDLLLHITGGVSVDYFKNEGDIIKRGELLAILRQGDKELKIASPVSGEILMLNKRAKQNPGTVNTDPYGKGWITKVKPAQWKEETDSLMLSDEAEKWSEQELKRIKLFMFHNSNSAVGTEQVVMQTGGDLIDFPLMEVSKEIWGKFQCEFLD